jgi:hypothetical protein
MRKLEGSIVNFRIARHLSTIQKLIWPSRRANAFRNLPDGEAAKVKKLSNRPNTKNGTEAWRTVVRDSSHVWSCR